MTSIRRALSYSIATSYFALPLQIIGTMIMSRLLTPAETGVFAVAAVFASLASTFRDFGVAEYLIQEKELNSDTLRAALTVNITISWAMGLILFFSAPFAADFYRSQGVAEVMRIQALNFVLIPFGAVTMANFRRQLDFRPIFIASACAGLTSFTTAILCALSGLGYMSLAWSSLGGVVAMVAASFWLRPSGFPRWPGVRGIGKIIHFGTFASGIYIFGQIGRGAPEMIIGRAQDLVGVAMFSRGYGLVELFNRSVLNAIVPVCLPYFAKDNRENGSVVGGYLKSISNITVIGWPFLAFIGIIAYAAIRIVYGDQWLEAVPLAQILCIVGAIELIHYLAKEAMLATGDVKRSNALQIGLQCARVLGLLGVIPYGLSGACFGLLAAAVFGAALSQWNLSRTISLRFYDVLKTCIPSALIAIVAVAPVALWVANEGISEGNFLRFAFGGGAITASMWLFALRLFKHQLWIEVARLAQKLVAKYRSRRF